VIPLFFPSLVLLACCVTVALGREERWYARRHEEHHVWRYLGGSR